MQRLAFELGCPRCAGEFATDPDVVEPRPATRTSSRAVICTGCGARELVIVLLRPR